MSPAAVTNEVLLHAKLMWAQLLIHTHTPKIIQFVRDIYDINLEIHSMKLGDNALLIQVDLEDLFTEYTVTTFGCHQLMSNILEQLNQRIEDDIDLLYEAITQCTNKYTVCTTGREFWDRYIKYFMLS